MTYGPDNRPYDALGGEETVQAIVGEFYDEMDRNPAAATIRALHPDDLASSREKLFEFLSGWLGGPDLFVQKHGHPRLRQRHAPFAIGPAERDQWLACMAVALDANAVEGELRQFLDAQFAHVADFMRNMPG
jgi:hemoglobin